MWLAVTPPPVSDAVLISIISSILGPSVLAGLGFLLNRKVNKLRADTATVKSQTKRTLVQVENSHTTNLREEGDERHDEQVGMLREIIAEQKEMKKDIGGMRADIRHLSANDLELARRQQRESERLDEFTQPRAEGRKIIDKE